jgi:outer membrane PBP1 activator LpoA protein
MKHFLSIPCLLLAMLFSSASLANPEHSQGKAKSAASAEASTSQAKSSRSQEGQEFNALDALVNSIDVCDTGNN